jgi:hypothetical protein
MSATFEPRAFGATWSALTPAERRRLRRMVRIGRTGDDPALAPIAPLYAQHQLTRPWIRLFWLWFVPGIFLVLSTVAKIHPILVGVTIALGAQAVWAYFCLRKIARSAT